MRRINLLPSKHSRARSQARLELGIMGAAVLVVLLVLYGWYYAIELQVREAKLQISAVQASISGLTKDEGHLQEMKAQAETLEKKIGVIRLLQQKKTGPALMLDNLTTILTEHRKVWLEDLQEKDGKMTLSGGAMSTDDYSGFLNALKNQSQFYKSIAPAAISTIESKDTSYVKWSLTCETTYATAG